MRGNHALDKIEVLFGQGGVFSDPDHLLLHLRVCDY